MRRTSITAVLVVALLSLLIAPVFAQQGGRGGDRGGRRGTMGLMMYLERTWTLCSFKLECTAEQLEQLRPTYATALDTRDEAVQAAAEAQDWEAIGTALQACKDTLDAKLAEVLSEEQNTKLQEMATQRFGGMRRGPGGPPAPGAPQ